MSCSGSEVEAKLSIEMVYRHPFPGPGLGVRILGEAKAEYPDLLLALSPAQARVQPHHQRGARHQQSNLQSEEQAASHHRVGVSAKGPCLRDAAVPGRWP